MNPTKEHQFEGVPYPIAKGRWVIFPGLCKGCGLCIEKCARKAIVWSSEPGAYGTPRVALDSEKCANCGVCSVYCPDAAISLGILTGKGTCDNNSNC